MADRRGQAPAFQAAILTDCHVVRVGLRALVEQLGVPVILEVPASPATASLLQKERCNLALLDVGTTKTKMSTAVCETLANVSDSLIVVGVHACGIRPPRLRQLFAAGMSSYVSIGESDAPLRSMIRALSRGQSVIHLDSSNLVVALDGVPGVSDIDIEIVQLLVEGRRDEEIGKVVGLHATSVKHRVQALERVHGLRDRCELGAWAVASGLVEYQPVDR